MRTATYLYCLVKTPKAAPTLAAIPRGLEGMGAPRILNAGHGLWIVAADAPLAQYGESPIEAGLQDLQWVSACALAHEQVIEHFARQRLNLIPLKLFTLFSSDARALEYVAKTRKSLDKTFGAIDGHREWGVRVHLDEARAIAAARAKPAAKTTTSPGTNFLMLKKQEMDIARRLKEQSAADAESIYKKLAKMGKYTRRLTPASGEILAAACLVPIAKEKAFQASVKKLSGDAYELILSGPWPPYNFIEDRK